jgi:signal transduction histidine kinase
MLSLFANQAALAIQNQRLLNQLKHQFRYMAHSTTTPLHSIGLLIDQIYQQKDRVKAEHSYRTLKTVIADLDTNIKNPLTMSRYEARALKPSFAFFDLRQLVVETLELFALEAADQGISLRKPTDSKIDPAWGDRGMITQVLHNLVKNALIHAFPASHLGKKV